MISIYFHGFWSGFFECTNPTNVTFFKRLFSDVYNTEIHISSDIHTAEILVENTQVRDSLRLAKAWRHTFLFSGESYIRPDYDKYSCVLYGQRNHKNIVNVPLYIPYLISSFDESLIKYNKESCIQAVPKNDVVVIISNNQGKVRNAFLDELEKHMNVTYAGHYKNNIGKPIPFQYNTPEFQAFIGSFKFVISMENSEEDTYITEKITHGILGGSIPIYWGSKRASDYFNSERFIEIRDINDFSTAIAKMKEMKDKEWLSMVNKRPFTTFGQDFTLKKIAGFIKNLVFPKPFPSLTSCYIICNPEFEPIRFQKCLAMCEQIGFQDGNVEFICPTYKHTISDEAMRRYVLSNRIQQFRDAPIRKSEISLFFNFIEVWSTIERTYKDGTFLILESDAFLLPTIINFERCLKKLSGKQWSAINISSDGGAKFIFSPSYSYIQDKTPYREYLSPQQRDILENNCIEDLSTPQDVDVRFMRKYHTRCTDSQIWSYHGCCQMLKIIKENLNFDLPLDYYITDKLEKYMDFKYYWSDEAYFDQASNRGLDKSTIQKDNS